MTDVLILSIFCVFVIFITSPMFGSDKRYTGVYTPKLSYDNLGLEIQRLALERKINVMEHDIGYFNYDESRSLSFQVANSRIRNIFHKELSDTYINRMRYDSADDILEFKRRSRVESSALELHDKIIYLLVLEWRHTDGDWRIMSDFIVFNIPNSNDVTEVYRILS